MDLETRLTNLENLVFSFIENQSRADDYKTYDIEGCRQADNIQVENITANSEAIEETNVGLMETYEETANNATSIDEIELALEEVYEMIGE